MANYGLYDPSFEHDACGIGFVANINGQKSHEIIVKGIQVLINLTHRGACGCDPETGDGAGVLIQIPHKFFTHECSKLGFTLPPPGEYGIGMTFLPVEPTRRLQCEGVIERICGTFANPEELAFGREGLPRLTLYRVRFIQNLLWSDYAGSAHDTVDAEIYHHWLEPTPQENGTSKGPANA